MPRARHAQLCRGLAALDPARPVWLELGTGRPTAAALQLLQAALVTLRARGVTLTPGPTALTAPGDPGAKG